MHIGPFTCNHNTIDPWFSLTACPFTTISLSKNWSLIVNATEFCFQGWNWNGCTVLCFNLSATLELINQLISHLMLFCNRVHESLQYISMIKTSTPINQLTFLHLSVSGKGKVKQEKRAWEAWIAINKIPHRSNDRFCAATITFYFRCCTHL